MDAIIRNTRQARPRATRTGLASPRRVLSSKAMRAKRDEARVRNEARAVLGIQSRWLDVPNGMYGGLRPIDMVRKGHTQLVMDVLARVKYGMFS